MGVDIALSKQQKYALDRIRYKKARKLYLAWRNNATEAKIYLSTLFALAQGVCPFCKVDMVLHFKETQEDNRATLDHIDPLSKTMEHDKFNLQIMCYKCNTAIKGSRMIETGDYLVETGAVNKEDNEKWIKDNI